MERNSWNSTNISGGAQEFLGHHRWCLFHNSSQAHLLRIIRTATNTQNEEQLPLVLWQHLWLCKLCQMPWKSKNRSWLKTFSLFFFLQQLSAPHPLSKVRQFPVITLGPKSDSPLADLFIARVFLLRIPNADNSSWESQKKPFSKFFCSWQMTHFGMCHSRCAFHILSFSIISASVSLPLFGFCLSAALEAASPSGAGIGSITDLVYTWDNTGKKNTF